jgi:hypothetical protein
MQVNIQLHAPAALPRGNHPQCSLDRPPSGRCGEERKLALPGTEPGPFSMRRHVTADTVCAGVRWCALLPAPQHGVSP